MKEIRLAELLKTDFLTCYTELNFKSLLLHSVQTFIKKIKF
jgi:hypothetical protein